MKITKTYIGVFQGDPFTVGATDLTGLWPLYVLPLGNNSSTETLSCGVHVYEKPLKGMFTTRLSNYDDLLTSLRENLYATDYRHVSKTGDRYYTARRGYLAHRDGGLLAVLCARCPDPFAENGEARPEKLVHFVANDFHTDPRSRGIYKKVTEIWTGPLMASGVETVFLPPRRIEEKIYRSGFGIGFSTLEELRAHLENEVRDFLPEQPPPL